jgi:hypothetical protein
MPVEAWLAGWILRPAVLGTTFLEGVEAYEPGTTPLDDCLENAGRCDTFALAVYYKMLYASLSVLEALRAARDPAAGPLEPLLGGMEHSGRRLIELYLRAALGRRAPEELKKMAPEEAVKLAVEVLNDAAYTQGGAAADLRGSAAKFTKLYEIGWQKVVAEGRDVLVRFAPNLWLYGTRVRAYGSYPMLEVYGFLPVPGAAELGEASRLARELFGTAVDDSPEYRYYPVFVPLRVWFERDGLKALGIGIDEGKSGLVVPMYPPHSIPGVAGLADWSDVAGKGATLRETVLATARRLARRLSLKFPYFWTYHVPAQPMAFTTITVDCKYAPHWKLMAARAAITWERVRAEAARLGADETFLALAVLISRACSGASHGKISASAKAAVASQFTAMLPHVMTPLVNGPLMNAFYWRVMYDAQRGDAGALEGALSYIAAAMGALRWDELDQLSADNVPIYNMVNAYFALGTLPIPVKLWLRDNTERRELHEMYAFVLPLPNWALVGHRPSDPRELYDTRSGTFIPAVLPAVFTVGRENVHLDHYPYTVGGRLLEPFKSVDDLLAFAEHLYCVRERGSECGDPATVLVERGGRLEVDAELLEGRHPHARKWFVRMERMWWTAIDETAARMAETGMMRGTLSETYFALLRAGIAHNAPARLAMPEVYSRRQGAERHTDGMIRAMLETALRELQGGS